MSREQLEEFRRLVLEDEPLQQQLQRPPDRDTFLTLTVRLGQEHGYAFTVEDVEAALADGRRTWIERWQA